MDHRQIHHPLDARFMGEVKRDQRLGEFIGHHGVEQKERGHAGESFPQGVNIEKVALNYGNAWRELGLRRIADESADIGSALDEVVDDLAADIAGCAGNEDGHWITPVWVKKTPQT
ncbi:hypothetical protein GCM10016234_16740 [Tianweitania populi]|uniref:Uncharacterized protein n=1 Tax=Tianweitania populi TaxID=1607949 RepID=A0A8J3DYE0_9HYPH|nr:hypothetical protein GCM10016234_16740 [Tianweitania populi]